MSTVGDRTLAGRLLGRLDGGQDHVALRRQASSLLRRHIGYDLAVWATVDPATVMWTSCVLDGMSRDEELENQVFANEYGQADVLKLTDLAAGDRIGALSAATDGDPAASPRFREVLAPRGFTDELRLVFHDGDSAWGALCLYRAGGRFTHGDLAELAPLGRPFAGALRSSLVRGSAGPPPAGGESAGAVAAGLILAGTDGRILEINADAQALLGARSPEGLPQAVQAVVARRVAGLPASTTVPAGTGWLALHATDLGGSPAVVVERVRPQQMAGIVVRSRGLTPREQHVLEHVARGSSNRQVARALGLSEYTVQDHLKAIFTKFEVNSRNELLAALFFNFFAPLHAADESLRSDTAC
ncbi:LuxR C-terminal-related transcriptional regulator [Streptomyces sp. GC420]|uniref:helix-turn-helix transcriptional regulator n=1 Tax=Streptomyces sp. GC420 TaxID=2697568 RepID=UPI0014150949|nr:LuxR C-terminal-related transcriptional regulator [Streptomyces sp. GC420]NBM19667.1 hypothetical protein [Streptomyces sp. GC420]